MASELELKNEERNRNIGLLGSAIIHLLLTLIVFITGFTYYDPPLEPINAVFIEFSQPQPASAYAAEILEENEERVDQASDNLNSDSEEPHEIAPASQTSILKEEAPVVINSKKNTNAKEKESIDQKAKEKASRLAEEKQKRKQLEESKQKFSNILGKGKEASAQNSDSDNSSGESALAILSEGSGSVGKGFGNRSVVYEPVINETSQKTGTVVVTICIDAAGNVKKASYTQNGSTTTDAKLVRIAEKAARKYKFTTSDTPEQCGDIVIEFKVR
jgi:hypothetical protein